MDNALQVLAHISSYPQCNPLCVAFHEFMNVIVLFNGKWSIRVWFYDGNFMRHDMNAFQSTEV